MPTPSLTLARRLYAKKHRVRISDVRVRFRVGPESSGRWLAWMFSVSRPGACGVGKTESAALRKLCRALGWKP